MTLNSRVLSLRTILMTLVAAVAVSVTAPSARADAADVINQQYLTQVNGRFNSMFLNINSLQNQLHAQLIQDIGSGKSYVQLVKTVQKFSKKAEKEATNMAKDVQKISKQARKSLTNAGAPSAYIANTFQVDQSAELWKNHIHSLLPQVWIDLLNSLVP